MYTSKCSIICGGLVTVFRQLVIDWYHTFREGKSDGRLRPAAAAVDVDGGDSELIPVTRSDVAHWGRRQRRLNTDFTVKSSCAKSTHTTSISHMVCE